MPLDMLTKLRTFVLPDSGVSLKLVFDNVRNYAICGAMLACALWVLSQSAKAGTEGHWQAPLGLLRLQMTSTELKFTGVAALIFTGFLALLNIAQTSLLLLHPLLPPPPVKSSCPTERPVPARERSFLKAAALLLTLPLVSFLAVWVLISILSAAAAFIAK